MNNMKAKSGFRNQEGKKAILDLYDSFIEQWKFPHEEQVVETRFGKTHLITAGDKECPPLILLHGTGMNSAMWLEEIKSYAKEYRVYAPDIPGEPGKSDERQQPLKGKAYALWLSDVLDSLQIEKVTLIGISLGAWLAVKFSIHYPECVEKLVLIAPSGISPAKKSFLFTALYYGLFGEKGTEKLYIKINGGRKLPEKMLVLQKLIKKGFRYRMEEIPIFRDDEIKRLSMPVALYVGGKDIMLPSYKTADRLRKLLPHSQINVLPREGHSITRLSAEIMSFLKGD